MNDICRMGGRFRLQIFKDQEAADRGEALKIIDVHNKMTNASLAVISGLVGGTGSQTAFGYLGVGTSSTAVSAAHTALQGEIVTNGLERKASTNSRTTTTQTNDTLSLTATWTATGSSTIQEIGIFNAPSGGVMLARALTGTFAVTSGNVVIGTYTWTAVGN